MYITLKINHISNIYIVLQNVQINGLSREPFIIRPQEIGKLSFEIFIFVRSTFAQLCAQTNVEKQPLGEYQLHGQL